MKRLCSICARGGSKGVPNKNIILLGDKPLIAHSIEQARDSGIFDFLAVSSDSPTILQISQDYGVDFLVERPAELATDQAPKIPAMRHCMLEAEKRSGVQFDTFVDLDATAPLREVSDIVGAVELLETRGVSNVITGTPARRSPYFNLVEENSLGFVNLAKKPEKQIERRQDVPRCFDMNASIYVWRRDVILQSDEQFHPDTLLFEMHESSSPDIDGPLDWEWVQYLYSKRG